MWQLVVKSKNDTERVPVNYCGFKVFKLCLSVTRIQWYNQLFLPMYRLFFFFFFLKYSTEYRKVLKMNYLKKMLKIQHFYTIFKSYKAFLVIRKLFF